MSTATESKYTAGALRAARLISCSEKLRPLVLGLILRQEARESWAEIIDRETAAPAMLEALEELRTHYVTEGGYYGPIWNKAEAAIRLAKGESQ